MYACPNLVQGCEWAADTFGAEPAAGGAHQGLGTRNALLSLGGTYLEIIAPDTEQPLQGTMGERFMRLSQPGLVTWAVEAELNSVRAALLEGGVDSHGPVRTERKTPEGLLLVWGLLFPVDHSYGARMPFFIDWMDCAHPRDTNPQGGHNAELTVTHPDIDGLKSALRALTSGVRFEAGPAGLSLSVESLRGPVVLSSTEETSTLRMG